MKPLTVYKASAGSGKTFTLAVEYIKLLIDNPYCFKNILAVTFTNKATEEMKLRILSQLYGIWKNLPDSASYTNAVCGSLCITAAQASRQAGTALVNLVHNYHYFRVETIDSFFQSILRNLARELDLTANLKIGLNDIQVEEKAVDKLIDELDTSSAILQWLISYIFSNINQDKSWNVIGQIKSFGKTIFKDFYRDASKELNNTVAQQDFFNDYTRKINAIKANARKRMAGYADMFEEETERAGVSVDSYSNKRKGISSYFNKLRSDDFSDAKCKNKTLEKHLDNAENWTSKTSKDRDVIITLANNKLIKLLEDAEKERQEQWKLYSSADCTLRHLDKLRLLNSIERNVRELNNEANLFLLSDTQHLLHTLIKDSDTPFIFEKVGCRLEHIMIDEFQDTSAIQWQNFKVLLKECMSHADNENNRHLANNLIVGDVKQSIYRWRAGDWRLLNGINTQFTNAEETIETKSLQTNYRSERNIVDFNNSFFTTAARLEYKHELEINGEAASSELLTAYADVCQKTGNERECNGLVKMTLLPDEDYDTNMLDIVYDTIKNLIDSGIKQHDIAVLIRYNRHIPIIADYLSAHDPNLKIVSDEAFRLDASPAVNTIICALRMIMAPDDILSKAKLAVTYQKRILGSPLTLSEILTGGTQIDQMLPENFICNINLLSKKPLIEIVKQIHSIFKLDKFENQSAYICAFFDNVSDFAVNNTGDIRKFIETWDEDIHCKTIQSDELDGIRLISIHKSKGLEFDNVIIPYCDWAMESRDTTLWCNPQEKPFNHLPIVPVDYSKKLLETIYANDYRNEHIQNSVDNLNLMYVAFTRASKNLFVFGRRDFSKKPLGCRSELIMECLPELADTLKGATLCGIENEDQPVILEYGNLYVPTKKQIKKTNNVFTKQAERLKVNMNASEMQATFVQSNKSRDFISGNDNLDEQSEYIETGKILHRLFSMITTADDLETAIRQLEFEGVISGKLDVEKIKKMLEKRLSDKRIAEWFSDKWRVLNECGIIYLDNITGKTAERRPDRVMTDGNDTIVVDFKFGRKKKEYKNQVSEYMGLLEEMGYKNVKGYIWYVYTNEIENIH